ncbi:GntR family transcriptional regulator [Roseovarius sp.]|uniref:GntR family transcriptional regulator n=1 Tax=Roseovarius sp. TaxID=1486281 RepID=UPI003BA9F5B5
MTAGEFKNWQAVQEEVRRRIHARIWAPGEMIPNEQDLAEEFGCARATVNRALRNLSEAGLLERRRKAGTRVALHPVRKATLSIPMIRKEIEDRGQSYGYERLFYRRGTPPEALLRQLKARENDQFVRVKSVQTADGVPFVFEDRWVNLSTVPGAAEEGFAETSANEWLLTHAPYTEGDIAFFAENASEEVAGTLGCDLGAAIFVIDRVTWDNDRSITSVRQFFPPGYRMQTSV